MRKLIYIYVLATFLATSFQAQSQFWIDVGLKGGPGTSFLLNSDMFDDAQFNHKFTFSYFAGGKIGLNFGETSGITVNVTTTQIAQKFANTHDEFDFSDRAIRVNTVDIGLFYRLTKGSSYFEIGPQFSLMPNPVAEQDGNVQPDLVDNMASNYFGATIGFGGFIVGGDRLALLAGLQASYGFTDIFPSTYDPAPPIAEQYDTGNSTTPLAIMLNLELNYSLGHLVRSSCGRRTTLVSF